MSTSSKECSISSFTVANAPWVFFSWLEKKKRNEKKDKERVKDREFFLVKESPKILKQLEKFKAHNRILASLNNTSLSLATPWG